MEMRMLRLGAFPLAILLLLTHCAAPMTQQGGRQPEPSHVESGKDALARQQYDVAMFHFEAAVLADPSNAEAYYGRAIVHGLKGGHDQAIADMTQVIKLEPSARAYGARGSIYLYKEQYPLAIADFNEALKRDPTNAAMFSERGEALRSSGEPARALEDFNQAISIDPKLHAAYFGRGMTRARMAQYDLAIADLSRAVELDPNYAEAYYSRSVCYYQKRDYPRAWSDLKRASGLGWVPEPSFLLDLRRASGSY
jgi:tetratricopeptide (TPR) repeat protein